MYINICNNKVIQNFQELIFYLLIQYQMKHMQVLKKVMERDFWSIENVSLDCKNYLELIFRFIKFGYAILILDLIAIVTGQYFLDVYPQWPFVSIHMYPYYVAAATLYTFGGYLATYTHFLIYCYACFHAHCQIVLLNEYFKQLKSDSCMNEGIEINVADHIKFTIKQHRKLIR